MLITTLAQRLCFITNHKHLRQQYAQWLLEAVTGRDYAFFVAHPDFKLLQHQQADLNYKIGLLRQRMPLQYVLGTVPFCDLELEVKAPIFIPRPETEQMCYWLIDQLKQSDKKSLHILDLCTGSGAIALSLAYYLPHAQITAVDKNPTALKLAQKNAAKHKLENVTFHIGDLYGPLTTHAVFDCVVSNPPYVSEDEWRSLQPEITEWEDKSAFVAAKNGLEIYQRICAKLPAVLTNISSESTHPQVVFEVGACQSAEVKRMLITKGARQATVSTDSYGMKRWVSALF